jgi:hypothetical protein
MQSKANQKSNSKGAAIFRKMLADKRFISDHLRKGGKLSDLKDQFKFAKPISSTRE